MQTSFRAHSALMDDTARYIREARLVSRDTQSATLLDLLSVSFVEFSRFLLQVYTQDTRSISNRVTHYDSLPRGLLGHTRLQTDINCA